MGSRNYSFDAKLLLADGAAAMTAAGITQVSGSNKILDMGGAQSRTDLGLVGGQMRIDMACVIDVQAISIANTNNLYTIYVMGSNVNTGANPVVLGSIQLGYGTALPNGSHSTGGAPAGTGSDSYAGRYELLFSNEQASVNYEFIYLYCVPAGTSPSIQFTAFGAVLPEE